MSFVPKSSLFALKLQNQEVWNCLIREETLQRPSTFEQTRQLVDYYGNKTSSPHKPAADLWDGEVDCDSLNTFLSKLRVLGSFYPEWQRQPFSNEYRATRRRLTLSNQ